MSALRKKRKLKGLPNSQKRTNIRDVFLEKKEEKK